MYRILSFLNGAALAAGLTYLLDPALGKRRRSLLRDQLIHGIAKTGHGADATLRDVRHRLYGTYAEMRGAFRSDEASDDVIADRVRSKIGRYVSHPSSIEVKVRDGVATLGGPILAHEVDDVLAAVKSVRGVIGVDENLEVHDSAGNISALQGGGCRTGEPMEIMQMYWSPTTRLALGTLGGLMMLNCAARRTIASPLVGAIGFGLALRALTNLELKRLFGLSDRRGVDVHKTIIINRPVDEVFGLLADPASYPKFTGIVKSVRDLGDGSYQKTLAGPAGAEVKLHETITRYTPNEFIAFRSEPDSFVQYAGRARFVDLNGSHTKVEIDATYNPPGGVLSHSAAWLAGMDLKSQLDDVLLRAKSYLETGIQPHDAAQGDGRERKPKPAGAEIASETEDMRATASP
jgi:uncharacterized membrane protein